MRPKVFKAGLDALRTRRVDDISGSVEHARTAHYLVAPTGTLQCLNLFMRLSADPTPHLIQVPCSRMNLSSPFSPTAQIDDTRYPPQPTQNQPSQGLSNFIDGSGHIFSMYLEMATEDKRMTDNWKADADGILIFVRRHILILKLHLC